VIRIQRRLRLFVWETSICSVFYLLCSERERRDELLSGEADVKWGALTVNGKAVAHKETRSIPCPAKRQDQAMKTRKHIMMQSAVNSVLRCVMCVVSRNRWTSQQNRYLLNDLKPRSHVKSFLHPHHDMILRLPKLWDTATARTWVCDA
jgi:hypothetical protein